MNFEALCDLFQAVRSAKGGADKARITKEFIATIRGDQELCFAVLRLMVPKMDRDRPSYRIKELKISKILVRMLDLPAGSDKNVLTKSYLSLKGDFGDVVYTVLKKYIVSQKTVLTVHEVNSYLDRIANRVNDSGLDDLILEIFRKLSCKDTKWFIQILLKDLKLGITDNSIVNCYHEDAANFYTSNTNLRKVSETLRDPSIKLHELQIQIFHAFQPMLSKRCDSSNFKKCFPDNGKFIIENKFDGERFQLHMENGKFKYFSRRGFDFTDSYGKDYTPRLKDVFGSGVKSFILDGEMMLWNKMTKKFGSKGMSLDVKNLGKGRYQPCFCVFDILLYNDKVLTNQPLQSRLTYIKKAIAKPLVGTIIVSEYMAANCREDIVKALNTSVDNNEEGIVVKNLESVYKFGERNCGWFKVKMEYFDDVVHDLDVLMMGGSYGSGGKLNSFIVGILSGNQYLSMGRIGTGLNDEQLDLLNTKLKSQGTDFKQFSTKSSGMLQFGKEVPDIYIEPRDSCVLTIRATELTRSTSEAVKTPYTLRFPRVLAIREDKPVEECLSMNELLDLTRQNKSVIKLNKRHIELDEIVPKVSRVKRAKLGVVNKLEHSKSIGTFLSDKKFYVLSGTEQWPKDDIYNSIKLAGGQLAYKLEPGIDIALVSKFDETTTKLIEKPNDFDVVLTDWLRRVLDSRQLMSYDQKEIVSRGLNYKSELTENFDSYGDSFDQNASQSSLQRVFDLMSQRKQYLNVNNSVVVDEKLHLFADYVAYFDSYEYVNNPESGVIYDSFLDQLHFEYYKGSIDPTLSKETNLVIVGGDEDRRRTTIITYMKQFGEGWENRVKIVPKSFLYKQK